MQNCGSSFVNSCVKMPIDPYSRQPTPSYERPTTALNSTSPDKSDKCSKTEDNTTPSDLLAEASNSPENVQDFLDFLNSIPDYGEIHHLSNEQFSQQLEYLKRKRTILLTNLRSDESKKHAKDAKKFLPGKKGAKKKRKSRNKEKQKYGDDYKLNLKGKKCRLEEGMQSPIMFERRNFKDLTRDQDLLNYRLSNKEEKSLRNKEILLSARSWSDRSDEMKRNCLESDGEFCNENKTLTSTTPQRWHPTLPKPFTFTVREDVEKQLSNIECQLNKSSPSLKKRSRSRKRRLRKIPKTSRIPLYDKLMAEKEERSRIIREESAINLLSQIQPFKLECEQRAWKCISRSSPDLTSRKSNSSLQFKAKPVPKNLFNTDIYDKMLEDEYFRHLQKKIRAMDLMKSSSLPPSMARRHKIESSSLNSNVHSKDSTCGKSSKASGLYTSSSSSDRPKSSIMLKRQDGTNLAAILRCQASRQKLEQEIQARLAERERIENEKFRQALLAKKPAWKALRIAARYDHERDLNYRTKLRRNEAREQADRYRLQMELMLDRVTRIPTLFERYSQNFHLYAQSLRDLQQNNKPKGSKLGRSSTESYASFGSSSTSSLRCNTGSSMSSSETIVSVSNNSSNSSKSSKSRKPSLFMNNTRKKNDRGALKVSINENAELIEDKLELETNTQVEIEDKVQNKDNEHS